MVICLKINFICNEQNVGKSRLAERERESRQTDEGKKEKVER